MKTKTGQHKRAATSEAHRKPNHSLADQHRRRSVNAYPARAGKHWVSEAERRWTIERYWGG